MPSSPNHKPRDMTLETVRERYDKAPSDEAVEAAVEVLDGKFIDELDKQQALAHWREPVTEALQAALPFLLADEREARERVEQTRNRAQVDFAEAYGRAEKAEAALLEAREALKVADGWFEHGPGATTHEHASDVVRAALGSPEEADRG